MKKLAVWASMLVLVFASAPSFAQLRGAGRAAGEASRGAGRAAGEAARGASRAAGEAARGAERAGRNAGHSGGRAVEGAGRGTTHGNSGAGRGASATHGNSGAGRGTTHGNSGAGRGASATHGNSGAVGEASRGNGNAGRSVGRATEGAGRSGSTHRYQPSSSGKDLAAQNRSQRVQNSVERRGVESQRSANQNVPPNGGNGAAAPRELPRYESQADIAADVAKHYEGKGGVEVVDRGTGKHVTLYELPEDVVYAKPGTEPVVLKKGTFITYDANGIYEGQLLLEPQALEAFPPVHEFGVIKATQHAADVANGAGQIKVFGFTDAGLNVLHKEYITVEKGLSEADTRAAVEAQIRAGLKKNPNASSLVLWTNEGGKVVERIYDLEGEFTGEMYVEATQVPGIAKLILDDVEAVNERTTPKPTAQPTRVLKTEYTNQEDLARDLVSSNRGEVLGTYRGPLGEELTLYKLPEEGTVYKRMGASEGRVLNPNEDFVMYNAKTGRGQLIKPEGLRFYEKVSDGSEAAVRPQELAQRNISPVVQKTVSDVMTRAEQAGKDEYVYQFGLLDSQGNVVFREKEGNFVSIGQTEEIRGFEDRLQQSIQAHPEATELVVYTRKPFIKRLEPGEPIFTERSYSLEGTDAGELYFEVDVESPILLK